MEQNKLRNNVFEISQILIGNAMSAFAIACFALPYKMVLSGTTGIARAVNYFTGAEIVYCVYALNIAFFLLGLFVLGKKFALTVLVGSVSFPVFLDLFQRIAAIQHLVDDPLLAAISAAVLDGVGIGLILRCGGSTGGIDVMAIVLNKKLGFKVAPVMYVIEVLIFLSQLPFTATNGIILGILYALLYTVVMNKIIVMSQGGIQVLIFSKKSSELNERLLQLGYGTSMLCGRGGYLQEEQDVIMCVAASRSLNRIRRAVFAIDERAFLTIGNVSEVNGNGFTTWFGDEDYVPEVENRRNGADILDEQLSRGGESHSDTDC